MGKLKKEDVMYIMGMEHALNVGKAAEPGKEMEAIKNEVMYRTGGNPLPLVVNVSRQQMAGAAREFIKPEIKIMSAALAWTLQEGLKLPPGRIAQFLQTFNEKINAYRHDGKLFESDQTELDGSWNLQQVEEMIFRKGDNENA